jgi:hypothetical protein
MLKVMVLSRPSMTQLQRVVPLTGRATVTGRRNTGDNVLAAQN